jgi:YkoY family integral membrane protein
MGEFFTNLAGHISTQDLALLGFLVFLEGILSIDNALVLAMMANHLPKEQQKKALTYGLLGSVVFRLLALGFARKLMQWHWVKLAGGAYLIYVAVSHLWNQYKLRDEKKEAKSHPHGFWKTVALIEIMDIAFAVDSILAAVALTPKFWLVFSGGMIGVVLIRFAASAFLRLLSKFPGFESTAYLLVLVIGMKLIVDWLNLPGINFHSSASPGFWVFWGAMLVCIAFGFRPQRKRAA